jgi:hypothetical protein
MTGGAAWQCSCSTCIPQRICPWSSEFDGVWRSPRSLTVSSPRTRRMGSRVGVESQPWCARFWTGSMPSLREGDGSQRVGWGRGCSRGEHGPPARLTGWGTSSRRCVRPLATRCWVQWPAKPWRSRPARPRGCLRTPPRWPSRGPMRTHRRCRGRLGLPTGRAQTVGMTANRGCSGWA